MEDVEIPFDWDEGNWPKCGQHGVSRDEIEAFFLKEPRIAPDIKHGDQEQRFLATGRNTAGRPLFVVFTMRGSRIRPLSARYMHAKEAQRYEEST